METTIGESYLDKSAEILKRQQQAEFDNLPGRNQTPAARKRGTPNPKKKPVEPRPRPQNLITPMEAAKRLGLLDDNVVRDPRMAVLRMARRCELVGVKVGRCTRIRPESVDRWISGEA